MSYNKDRFDKYDKTVRFIKLNNFSTLKLAGTINDFENYNKFKKLYNKIGIYLIGEEAAETTATELLTSEIEPDTNIEKV